MTLSSQQLVDLVPRVKSLMADAADRLIVPRFRRLDAAQIKTKTSDTDLVTVADIETEQWLTPKLAALLPGSLVVGEEAVSETPSVLDALATQHPVWVIDPVDGTRNFAKGSETFVSMLALVQNQQPLMGMIWRPLTRQLVWAAKGSGAWRQDEDGRDQALGVRQSSPDPTHLVGSISFKWLSAQDQSRVRANVGGFAKPGNLGCAGEEYARMAEGKTDYSVFGQLNAWDHCPGLVILREAGGADMLTDNTAYSTSSTKGRLVAATSNQTAGLISTRLFAD